MSFFAFTIVAMVGVVVQPSAARSPPRLTALARQPPIKMQQLQMEEHRSSTPAVSALSQQMTDASARLKADEQASVMIQALRGTNLNDDNAAAAGTRMQVVEMVEIVPLKERLNIQKRILLTQQNQKSQTLTYR